MVLALHWVRVAVHGVHTACMLGCAALPSACIISRLEHCLLTRRVAPESPCRAVHAHVHLVGFWHCVIPVQGNKAGGYSTVLGTSLPSNLLSPCLAPPHGVSSKAKIHALCIKRSHFTHVLAWCAWLDACVMVLHAHSAGSRSILPSMAKGMVLHQL